MDEDTVSLPVVSTVEALARILRNQILDGTISPGERLREIEYAERFNVARHSFRAATQQLVHEGLLERTQNRGVHAPLLDLGDVTDIYRTRAALEVEALRLCVLEGAPTAEAERAVAALSSSSDDAPWRELVDLDLRFHKSFVDAVGSPRMSRLYAAVLSEITLCLVQLRAHYSRPAQEVADEHRALLEPVLAGDLPESERRFREHFTDAVANLAALIERRSAGTA